MALTKINKNNKRFEFIKLADNSEINIAADVHAIGHPEGNFWTYTKGVISQIRADFVWQTDDSSSHQADVLQTQTPINPGNSGGPLLLDNMKLAGVNSFGKQGADGLNFAVAITSVKNFLEKANIPEKNKDSHLSNRTKGKSFDRDGDGFKELILYDENDNGKIDLIEYDSDKDGFIDQIFIDKNENGVPELVCKIITSGGERVAVWSSDDNEDGIIDHYGYDFDLDGQIDKVEPA